MDESKFNLWRATFSFCFVDGFLSPEESKYTALPFSENEKKVLMEDLKSPPDITKLFHLITRPADRGFLINNIRLLSRLDGLSETEKSKIQVLQEQVLSKMDYSSVDIVTGEGSEEAISKKNYSDQLINQLTKYQK